MSDAVGIVGATAAVAQAVFGESNAGLAARLRTAFGQELGRARADLSFAVPSVQNAAAMADARRADGAGLIGRRGASLDARAVDAAFDARARFEDPRVGGHDERRGGQDDDRPGEAPEGAPDGTDARVVGIAERELEAIETALATVQRAADDAGCESALRGVVLPGPAIESMPDAPREARDCRLLVLCLAFDGELGATERVWGYGYATDELLLTVDARHVPDLDAPTRSADPSAEADGAWRTVLADGAVDGRPPEAPPRSPLACTIEGARHGGLLLGDDASGEVPASWSFVDVRVVAA